MVYSKFKHQTSFAVNGMKYSHLPSHLFHSVIVAALPYLPFATAVLLLRATTASEDIKHIIISSSNIAQHLYNYYILIYPLCLKNLYSYFLSTNVQQLAFTSRWWMANNFRGFFFALSDWLEQVWNQKRGCKFLVLKPNLITLFLL